MFGRRRRREEHEALIEALARLERGLEEQAQTQTATDATVHDLYSTLVETRSDLIKTVEYLYSVCRRVMERTEADQLERRALVEALQEMLTRPSTIELEATGERVLGGSFSRLPGETVDLTAGPEVEHRQPRWA